jgi:hypothetical protein
MPSNETINLPGLSANMFSVTTSGLSSGGYMSTEMHVIYPKHIKGSMVIGSGPFMMAKAKSWYDSDKALT